MDLIQKQKVNIIIHQGQGTTKNRLTQKLNQAKNSKNYKYKITSESPNSKIPKPDYTVQYLQTNEKRLYHFIFLPIWYHQKFPNYLDHRIKSLIKVQQIAPSNYNQDNLVVLILLQSFAENQKSQKSAQNKQINGKQFAELYKINQKQVILHFNNIQEICLKLNINCIPCFDIQSCKRVLQSFQQN